MSISSSSIEDEGAKKMKRRSSFAPGRRSLIPNGKKASLCDSAPMIRVMKTIFSFDKKQVWDEQRCVLLFSSTSSPSSSPTLPSPTLPLPLLLRTIVPNIYRKRKKRRRSSRRED